MASLAVNIVTDADNESCAGQKRNAFSHGECRNQLPCCFTGLTKISSGGWRIENTACPPQMRCVLTRL